MVTAFVLVGWIVSLCFHEFSHAIVAYWGGDTSVKEKGYLTFNPLKYTHPFFSIILPLGFLLAGGIALPGGAVWIDRARLRSKQWDMMVSLAGPAANLVLAVLMSIPFMLGLVDEKAGGWFWPAWALLAHLQVFCVILNLLPIPPLDGFGAIAPYLPAKLRNFLYAMSLFGFIIIFVVIWRVEPIVSILRSAIYESTVFLGIPLQLIDAGWGQFGI